jgi:hypothetical protein
MIIRNYARSPNGVPKLADKPSTDHGLQADDRPRPTGSPKTTAH